MLTFWAIYREIGLTIANQEREAGWGAKIVEKLSIDLRSEFEDMRGLSPRNLRYMRDFALAYPDFPFLQAQLAKSASNSNSPAVETILQGELAKLSWYHHITLLDKVKDPKIRAFYIFETIQNGWTRDVMVNQIDAGLYNMQGQLINNFEATTDQSELVSQVFKDPYKFDFIYLGKVAKERDLEDALAIQMTKVLQEFGPNFGFLGRQFRVAIGDKEFFYDLLFYHTKLKRYIIVELKIGDFKAEYIGKMNLYLSIADDQLRDERDEKSIGLILCKTKDGLVAEYALRDSNKPIGIAEYKLKEMLPEHIQGELPSIEEIEQNMEQELKSLEAPIKGRMEKLIQKLASVQQGEVKTSANYENLSSLFDHSIKPLFTCLLNRLSEFQEHFLTTSFFWYFDENVNRLDDLERFWKDEKRLTIYKEPYFIYRLGGFRKAGVDAFDAGIQLCICLDQYQYGIKLINYNQQQPFIKKLHGELLSLRGDSNHL
jgi:predicted nuclease of restriction endonuclease-like (RecB) superfamily